MTSVVSAYNNAATSGRQRLQCVAGHERTNFHSIYYREPGGIPHLGERLMLPSWLEAHRATVEAALPPLKLPAPRAAE